MYENIFREYDIRGVFGEELNEASVKGIGLCLGRRMRARGAASVSVGYDARTSAPRLFAWLVAGLNAAGLAVSDIGMLPTPVGYFSVFTKRFDANVMITGSHNPKHYNGFKITIGEESFFGADIAALGREVNEFLAGGAAALAAVGDDARAEKVDVLGAYVDFYAQNFPHLRGRVAQRLIFDCGNGVAGVSLLPILRALGLDARVLYAEPDGEFPHHHPDPSEAKNLADLQAALAGDFDIGIGFDGDADRVAVLTKKRVIKGDELAYLYALKMRNPRVLGEVKCSQNMYDEIDKIGKSFMGKTGHSNIKKAMRELGIDMAAEVSGHIFFKERFFGFDDGVYAAVRVLELLAAGVDLDAELDRLPVLYSTDEVKIAASDETKFAVIAEFKRRVLGGDCGADLAGGGNCGAGGANSNLAGGGAGAGGGASGANSNLAGGAGENCGESCAASGANSNLAGGGASGAGTSENIAGGGASGAKVDLGAGEIRSVIDIDGVRIRFDEGWALLRASNTSPVLVTRFEGKSREFVARLQSRVEAVVREIIAEFDGGK